MFGELPKLFDRNFVIAFVMPTTIFVSLLLWILAAFGNTYIITSITVNDPLLGTTFLAISVWFGGVLLAILNREIIRFLEGYGKWNPFRLMKIYQTVRFKNVSAKKSKLYDALEDPKLSESQKQETTKELAHVLLVLAENFPTKENEILATTFGNTIKSFEQYPRILYGFEPIGGWERLQSVIPKDFSNLISDAKSRMDFWVNIRFLMIILLIIYVSLVYIYSQRPIPWLLPVLIMVIVLSGNRTVSSARDWGDMVKASFDLYLSDLQAKLGYEKTSTHEDQQVFWEKFSQVMIYRDTSALESIRRESLSKESNSSPQSRNTNAKLQYILQLFRKYIN